MKLSSAVWWAIIFGTFQSVNLSPVSKGRFFFGNLSKGITFSRVTADANQPATNYSVRFVPLITLLAGFFPNFMNRLGQFTGINKFVDTRRFDVADPLPQANVTEPLEFDDEEEEESELVECDSSHLGLWPDKSDSQRYYKCEIDPKTPANANCIKDYFEKKPSDKEHAVSLQRGEVPGVKPCFLLSMMKCANGFKYSHKARICVPDIVFGSQL